MRRRFCKKAAHMAESQDILISVRQTYVESMLDGTKTAELRRKTLNVSPETRVWIYSKLPRGHVEAMAIVDRVVAGPPNFLWRCYSSRIAISRSDFDSYLDGVDFGCAILFNEVRPLKSALSLSKIKNHSSDFHPPQFFARLGSDNPELALFHSALALTARKNVRRSPANSA